jgi:hypothetical protein
VAAAARYIHSYHLFLQALSYILNTRRRRSLETKELDATENLQIN